MSRLSLAGLLIVCCLGCQASREGSAAKEAKGVATQQSNDPNAKGHSGTTSLMTAVKNKQDDLAMSLLKSGADPNAKDSEGDTPLTIAYNNRSNGDPLVLAMLDAGGDPNYTKPGDWSLMHFAIADPRGTVLLKKLIEKGIDAKGSEIDDSAYIISNGKLLHDPNSKPQPGNPFIYVAAMHGTPDGVRLLLDHGANPNAKDLSGRYVIFAATSGGVAMLRPFVEHGADVNKKDPSGKTLLAFVTGHLKDSPRLYVPSPEAEIAYLKAHGAHM